MGPKRHTVLGKGRPQHLVHVSISFNFFLGKPENRKKRVGATNKQGMDEVVQRKLEKGVFDDEKGGE
jgi:hypothetical protein